MKRTLFLFVVTIVITNYHASAQNADEIIFNNYKSPFNYVAASFVIDTGFSQSGAQRAFMIWANNLKKDSLQRFFSLSEYDPNLNFLTEHSGSIEKNGSVKNMFPKKIIKSKFAHVYYLLAYTTNSNHTISGINVYSSPVVYKIDGNTLSLLWVSKINLPAITPNNSNTVIEFNDMIETSDKNIVLVGKYATNTQAQEYILAAKIKGSSGAIMWRYRYNAGEKCNEAATSVAETTDKRLSLTGYVKKCNSGFNGNRDAFYMELQSTGVPVPGIYMHYVWPTNYNFNADKITCYTSIAGSDQLIISGYVDMQIVGAIDRQILILNIRQNGSIVTAQNVGDVFSDVCNDLLITRVNDSQSEYYLYLTGQTSNYNSQPTVSGEAYFLSAKFTATAGIISVSEMSIFPVTTVPYKAYRSRTGIEIKDAGNFKKFAILATGVYQPTSTTSATYTNVLIRDLNDQGDCIKPFIPPVKQFNLDFKQATVFVDSPVLKVYKEKWLKKDKLSVKELCQNINVDPYETINSVQKNYRPLIVENVQLSISPNPAGTVIDVNMADGSLLIGNNKQAEIRIYNAAMQLEKIVPVNNFDHKKIIPVADLRSGVYMLQLIRGGTMIGATFIKE